MTACDRCLRRTALIELLAPWLERARKPNRRRLPEVLALPDGDLIEALCGTKRAAVDGPLGKFDPARARVRAQAAGLEVVCRHASRYPGVLANASDAPAALHLIGDTDLLERAAREGAVAIVGSRRASSYGMEMARSLGRDLAACDVPVVSGMAYGVDSAAHEGALAAGGPTIAVMPGGADLAYPGGKRRLYEQRQDLRARDVGDATRDAPLPLELSGPQPDHGGACPDDGRGGGNGGLRLADHGRLRAGPRPRGRRGARAGDEPAGRRPEPAAVRGCGGGALGRRRARRAVRSGPSPQAGHGVRCRGARTRRSPSVWSRGCAGCSSPSRPGTGRSRAWPKGRTSPRCWPACRSSSSWGSSGVGPVETMCAVSDLPSQVWARAYA